MLPRTAWGVKLGHRRDVRCKTALPPKAEVHRRPCYVAKVPKPAVSRCSNSRARKAELFDYFVGAGKHCRGYFESERLGSGQVDDEIELGWLLDRQVARLRSMQNLVDIVGRAPE
jgi:hypothetical protein